MKGNTVSCMQLVLHELLAVAHSYILFWMSHSVTCSVPYYCNSTNGSRHQYKYTRRCKQGLHSCDLVLGDPVAEPFSIMEWSNL